MASIHLSIHFPTFFPGFVAEGSPNVFLRSHILQRFLGYPVVFTGKVGCITPLVCFGYDLASPTN